MRQVIDFETRSRVSLRDVGAYAYAQHPSTVVLCLSYLNAGGEPDLWWPGEPFPDTLRRDFEAAAAGRGVIHAHSAVFERLVYNIVLRRLLPDLPMLGAEAFDCTMARAAASGWPLKLETLGKAMRLEQTKDAQGTRLVAACSDAAKKWPSMATLDALGEYCRQDVRTETEALSRLPALSPRERRVWLLDQEINDRGVPFDVLSARGARALVARVHARAADDLARLTGGAVTRASEIARIVAWCAGQGVALPNGRAETIEATLANPDLPADVRDVLEIRADAGGAAVKKLDAALRIVSPDGRMHGTLQYHAAATGRWGGRGFQPQNLPRPKLKEEVDPSIFRVALDDPEAAEAAVLDRHGNVLAAVSDGLRGLIWAPEDDHVIRRADLNAIEARVLLWLAGHEDATALFRSGDCIYCETASRLYGRKIIKGVDTAERFIGKTIVLGCGYQMGPSRYQSHAASAGLIVTAQEAEQHVGVYRKRWHLVPRLWYAMQEAALRAVAEGGTHSVRGVDFRMHDGALCVRLRSGRVLRWQGARVEVPDDLDGRRSVMVMKADKGQWASIPLFGGLIVERVVQAMARDIMVDGMLRAREAGFPLILTVHDEIVSHVPVDGPGVKVLEDCMAFSTGWYADLALAAEGAEGERYGK